MAYLDMVTAMLYRATRLLRWPCENIFMQRGVFYSRPGNPQIILPITTRQQILTQERVSTWPTQDLIFINLLN